MHQACLVATGPVLEVEFARPCSGAGIKNLALTPEAGHRFQAQPNDTLHGAIVITTFCNCPGAGRGSANMTHVVHENAPGNWPSHR